MALTDIKDGISTIYNYKPAYNNMYEVEMYDYSGSNIIDKNNYIKFHSTSVTFDGESLNLTRNPITKNFQLNDTDAFTRASELTISIRECDTWEIKKYHDDWLACFYNKDNDFYISYPKDGTDASYTVDSKTTPLGNRDSLYRVIKIRMPKLSTKDEDIVISFNNVLPNKAPGLSLSWSNSSEIVNHQITYYVRDWNWEK